MPEAETEILATAADDLALLRGAAREAGAITMRYFGKDPQVWMKGGTSPVPNLGLFDPISSIDSGYAGSRAEQAVVGAMLSGRSGRRPASYGALGPLLYGPVVRAGGVER